MFNVIAGRECTVIITERNIYFAGYLICATDTVHFSSFTPIDGDFPLSFDKRALQFEEHIIDALVLLNNFLLLGSKGTLLFSEIPSFR
jgi:hypothetical protein